MGKATGYREQQLEYARIIGANTEADIVRKREHNRRLMEGKLADHVGAVRIVPTPGPHKTTERGFHSNIWMPDQEVQP